MQLYIRELQKVQNKIPRIIKTGIKKVMKSRNESEESKE